VAVTIPGGATIGTPNITLSLGTGDVLHLAQQIGALLATVQGTTFGQDLFFDSVDGSSPLPSGPGVSSPSASELVIANTSPLAASIPGGWTYVVQTGPAPATLTGTNVDLIPGTVGGVFNVSGNSTVAPNGGNNTVEATGTYLLSFGPGSNLIIADGVGTIATDGASTVVSSGNNVIDADGIGDVISAAVGNSTIQGVGSNNTVIGGSGSLTLNITGTGNVIQPNGAMLVGTVGGSNNLVYPGTASVDVTVTGSNDSVVGSSAPTTITASGNDVVFGGGGALTFVGTGTGTSTILGGGSPALVTAGDGGVVFSANGGTMATVIGGSGQNIMFGGSGSSIIFNSASPIGGFMIAGSGNETLNASGAGGAVTFGGSGGGGAESLVGSQQGDVFFVDNGSDTMTGNGGNDTFSFIQSNTDGGKDFITDFNSNDALFLTGYDSTASAFSTSSSGLTLTLSDHTSITFTNLTDQSQLNGHYMYVKPSA
jgi:hypothetical protein